MSQSASVFIVDDDEEARRSLVALVESMSVNPVSFASGEEFLEHVSEDSVGCLVTDLRMPGMNGIQLQKTLAERRIPLPVIVMTAYAETRATVEAMQSGAVTFLEKTCSEHELCEAISDGLRKCAEQLQKHRDRKAIQAQIESLTPGEREILQLITQGRPNKQVAAALDLSVRTVEDRRRRIMEKLGVDSFADLMRRVLEAELLSPGV